jgi:renalase
MNVVIIGAGLAGLSAATELVGSGHQVTVIDKGRGVGGRLATRRIGAAVFDHGAQFFTVRSDAFATAVDGWCRDGVVFEWCRGFGEAPDGYPRYAVHGGMTSLAKHLARGIHVELSALVFAINRRPDGWEVVIDDGRRLIADAVVCTAPIPQSYSLLVGADIELPRELLTCDYDRTLAILVVLDRPSAVPWPGVLQRAHETFSMVVDNQHKGISPIPALTLHANAEWSLAHWDGDYDETHHALLRAAEPFIGNANVVTSQFKRWRFATPLTPWPEASLTVAEGPIVLAGDAFAGPRIEGAWLSGRAAAHAISAD